MVESTFQRWIEEIILVILILMNILEFFGLLGRLSGDAEFVRAIVSMTAIAYILYKISFSKLLYGQKNNMIDGVLIFGYFLLIVHKIFEFSELYLEEANLLHDFLVIMRNYFGISILASFFIGSLILLFACIYTTFNITISEPSIVATLRGEKATGLTNSSKFAIIFLVTIGFFVIFFNLILEWLTLVIDAPLIILGIFFYIFKLHDLGKASNNEVVLFRIVDFVENFVERFVRLFYSKNTIMLGISGMLVLHLITDLGAFVVPYALGTNSNIYFQDLGENHDTIIDLFSQDKALISSNSDLVSTLFGYFQNTLGIFFLMLFPVFVWYILYLSHVRDDLGIMEFSDLMLSIFFSAIIYVIFVPVYKITSITSSAANTVGVDIRTQSILSSGNSLSVFLILSVIIFVSTFILSKIDLIKKLLFFVMALSGIGFFGYYLYSFFISLISFYVPSNIDLVSNLLKENIFAYFLNIDLISIFTYAAAWTFVIYSMIFLIITALFYVFGYISFLISIFKEQ